MKKPYLPLLTAALALAIAFFATCESPMGLGPPVDTTAPSVFIEKPSDNEFIKGIVQGKPVVVTGSWLDDFGVTSMKFEVFNKTLGKTVTPDNLTYAIDPSGKWRAEITLPATGNDDYTIKAFAYDSFKNEGAAEVNVRIDIIPPWIRSARTARHPLSGHNFTSDLRPLAQYGAEGYLLPDAYRNIRYDQIDRYQNEAFSLQVEIEPSYAEVAASRLFVKDENDAYLHTEELAPSGYWETGAAQKRFPQWNLTASQLERWRPALSSGAGYVCFEVHAWSEAAWDAANNRPLPGEPARVQRLDGTVYYPESDLPHIYIDPDNFVNNAVILTPNAPNALAVDFYDDDRLGEIYAKLVTKQAFDALVASSGLSEAAYLESLTDLDDESGNRAALKNAHDLTDLFQQQPGGDSRYQRASLGTNGLELGEYRLVALAKDDKSKPGYTFDAGKKERWSVYPPVRILIHNEDAPFIFIETPERENAFPDLTPGGGDSFAMAGYTLGKTQTASLAIAWVPKSLQGAGLANATAVLESSAVKALSPGQSLTAANGIKAWALPLQEAAEQTALNGARYFRADFSKIFHIVNDFQRNGALENDDKLFVIHAGGAGAGTYATFNLPGLKTGPEVEVTSHRKGAGHDPAEDLVLRMKASAGSYGVLIQGGSQIITDVTGAADSDADFAGPTAFNGSEWTRTVPSAKILTYAEGSTRVYAFRARDILGNVTELTREIILTDEPLLQSIACTETAGTFGIGTVLRFEASFSMPVRVTFENGRAPKMKLFLSDPGSATGAQPDMWAEYDAGAQIGNTLFFTYTVQEGDTTELLCTPLDAIAPDTALIASYGFKPAQIVLGDAGGALQNNSAIKLDGDRPSITRASFAALSGNHYSGVSYYTNGKKITLKLVTDEPAKILGSPQAVIRYGSSQIQLKAQYSAKIADAGGGDALYFTCTFNDAAGGGSNMTPMTQLEWGEPWFDFADGSAITDAAGNGIREGGYATLPIADRRGEPSERGYVKTTIPNTPQYTFFDPNPTIFPDNPADTILANPDMNAQHVRINRDFVLRIAGGDTPDASGLGGSVLYYSLYGGSSPQTVPGTTGTGEAPIRDLDAANKYKSTYERSRYSVTAWQEDLAGNRSPQAPARQVTINTRFPELISIEVALPDGVYPTGTLVTFRLNFSDKVKILRYGANISTGLYNPDGTGFTGFGINPYVDKDGEKASSDTDYVSQLLVDFNFSGGNGKDIKMGNVSFSYSRFYFGLEDEFGNGPVTYANNNNGTWITNAPNPEPESATNPYRPIGFDPALYPFQINRPDLEFRGVGPQIIAASPQLPADSGEYFNGGVISGNTFTLTFDVPVTKVHGKYITVRPADYWAIPPVLSAEEMNALLNHPEVQRERQQYANGNYYPISFAERLTHVDPYGIELPSREQDYYGRQVNNSYIKTTHGLKDIGGFVRPDTATKWVLKFDTDLYSDDSTGSNNYKVHRLREVFNTAQWKWQRIHAGSNQVTVNGNVVTVTLSEDLLPGRIWNVVLDSGAFIDAAGIPSSSSYYNNGSWTEYRFWSAGTAAPVVRVNRVSYNGRSDNRSRMEEWLDTSYVVPPQTDTEIRIDCETPGAAIRYDVIRTRFLPAVAQNTSDINGNAFNNIFTSTDTTDAAFFGSNLPIRTATSSPPHVIGLVTDETSPNTGYKRNTIGNDNASTAVDANGFNNTLLVPQQVQSTGGVAGITLTNGVPAWSSITALASNVRNAVNNNTGAQVYRTVDAGGTVSYGQYVFTINYTNDRKGLYVGEAYLSDNNYVEDYLWSGDPRLYSGRRDYVAAVARKNAVTDTSTNDGKRFAGPQLDISSAANEGVYKTTVIYRNPRAAELAFGHFVSSGVGQILFFGYAQQRGSRISVSGFPFKGTSGDYNFIIEDLHTANGSFYKTAYRLFSAPDKFGRGVADSVAEYRYPPVDVPSPSTRTYPWWGDITCNHIWNTWEIVTDWYLSGWGPKNDLSYEIVSHKLTNATGPAFYEEPPFMWNYESVKRRYIPYFLYDKIAPVQINENMVTATYGGVTYRYNDVFNGETNAPLIVE